MTGNQKACSNIMLWLIVRKAGELSRHLPAKIITVGQKEWKPIPRDKPSIMMEVNVYISPNYLFYDQ